MNALELADYLKSCSSHEDDIYDQASIMLLQQHAEIEALKKKIQNMALDLLTAHAQADDHWVELQKLRGEK